MDPGLGRWLASEKPRQVSLYDHSDSKFGPLDKPEEVYYEESTQALEGPRQTTLARAWRP